jgi:hypothetical protein
MLLFIVLRLLIGTDPNPSPMSAHIGHWTDLAWQLDAKDIVSLKVPLHILTAEAVDVARFFQRRWSAERDAAGKVILPGLELCSGHGGITPELGDEILALQQEVQAAKAAHLLTRSPKAEPAPTRRAAFVLAEIRAALAWLMDDGIDDERDAQLKRLNETHRHRASQDALAAALDDYVALASRYRDELDGLGDFDVALLDEAKTLAVRLRERSAERPAPRSPNGERSPKELRKRLAFMLRQRMLAVRSAAQFVFRHHPAVVREVTSAYDRKRRTAWRKKKAAAGSATAPTG